MTTKAEENKDAKGFGTTELACYGKSMIGGRSENQDSFDFKHFEDDRLVATVCDGMGGANGGAVASQTAVEAITGYFSESHPTESGEEQAAASVKAANDAVYQEAVKTPALRGMGTTATVVAIDREAAYIAYAGDSRIYQIREGKKIFRTFDHSRVFELVKAKRITEEEARLRPDSNVIMRALGIRPEIIVDTAKLPYKKGDRFVLCCDGVWGSMPEKELIHIFSASGTVENIVESITSAVDCIGKKTGGHHDNLTVIVVEMKVDSKYQPSILKRMMDRFTNRKKN